MMSISLSPSVDNTSCRSREPTHTKLPSQSIQAPWTATRCLRLLRPLSSKLSLLTKLSATEKRTATDNLRVSDDIANVSRPVYLSHDGSSIENIPIVEGSQQWDSNPRAKKRLKCTYSGRLKATRLKRTVTTEDVDSKHHRIESCSTEDGKRPTSEAAKEVMPDDCCSLRGKAPHYEAVMRAAKLDLTQTPNLYLQDTHEGHTTYSNVVKPPDKSKERWKLSRGITDSLLALLKATDCPTQQDFRGPASLFSMCLTSVPEVIFLEEAYQSQEDADKEYDAPAEIYGMLEGNSISDNWKPLRRVVRSHGISIVCQALRDGVLGLGIGVKLISSCVSQNALEEARTIMRSMLSAYTKHVMSHKPEGIASHWGHHIMNGLQQFTERSAGLDFVFRQLTGLLDAEMPLTSCWPFVRAFLSRALKSALSDDNDTEDACNLLRAVIRVSYGGNARVIPSKIANIRQKQQLLAKRTALRPKNVQSERSQQTMDQSGGGLKPDSEFAEINPASLLAMLCAFQHGGSRSFSRPEEDKSIYVVSNLMWTIATGARQDLEMFFGQSADVNVPLREDLLIILFATAISNLTFGWDTRRENWSFFEELAQQRLSDSQLSQFGQHVALAAKLEELVSNSDSFDAIQTSVDRMRSISSSANCSKSSCRFLRHVIVKAASAFTVNATKLAHLEWALAVEEEFFGKSTTTPERPSLRTPARTISTAKPAFRWEEDICAWIVRTPAEPTAMQRPQVRGDITELDELVDAALAGSPMPKPRPPKRCLTSHVSSSLSGTDKITSTDIQTTQNVSKMPYDERSALRRSPNTSKTQKPAPTTSSVRTLRVSCGDIEMADELGEESTFMTATGFPKRSKPNPLQERRTACNHQVKHTRLVDSKTRLAAKVGSQAKARRSLQELIDNDGDGLDELSF